MQKIGLLQFLRDSEARSLVDARSSPLARAMAGMARFLYELAAGAPAVDGEDNVAGRNPQSLEGVDLSGPPWGPALLHPLAWWSGIATDVDVIAPSTIWTMSGNFFRRTGLWPIWVRPFEEIDGVDVPYSRGFFAIRAHKTGTDTDLFVRARNVTKGQSFATTTALGNGITTLSLTSTSETSFAPTDLWLDLVPGLNVIEIECFEASGGAIVDSLAIYQRVKLEH